VESAEYLLPAGCEPAVVRCEQRRGDGSSGENFVLRSSDVRMEPGSGAVEIWVRFHLKTTHRPTYPRPIVIGGGDATPSRRPDSEHRSDRVTPRRPDRRPSRTDAESGVKVTVPNVVGQDSGMATLQLMRVGFKVNLRRQSGVGPATQGGAVANQEPAAGSSAPKGSTVILTVP
jgi:hypothetical protein